MIQSGTYRALVKVTALLLMIGVALPTGLCAKQLMEFCHTAKTEHMTEMPESHTSGHEHCPTKGETKAVQKPADSHQAHDCADDENCVCHIGQTEIRDQNWITPNPVIPGTLTEYETTVPSVRPGLYRSPGFTPPFYSTPPIFLLNSTFLN